MSSSLPEQRIRIDFPQGPRDILSFKRNLTHSLRQSGLLAVPSEVHAGIGPGSAGFDIADESQMLIGFLRLSFDSDGLTAMVPQNAKGRQILNTFSLSINRIPAEDAINADNVDGEDVYACFFPKDPR